MAPNVPTVGLDASTNDTLLVNNNPVVEFDGQCDPRHCRTRKLKLLFIKKVIQHLQQTIRGLILCLYGTGLRGQQNTPANFVGSGLLY